MEHSILRAADSEVPLARLSRRTFWGIFALTILMFLFGHGPIWEHPWSIAAINDAILWSYLPIPPLVALGLAASRKLSLRAFFLDTLSLTLLKYASTFAFALVLWTVHEPPKNAFEWTRSAREPAPPAKDSDNKPLPTHIDPTHTGAIAGRVEGAGSVPVAGALVFISRSLGGLVFAAPTAALEIQNDGNGILPRVGAAVLRQPISARSADGRLHTLVAVSGQETVFNVPLLPSGVARPIEVAEPHVMELRCTVHPQEEHALVAVLSHPFFARTDEEGGFRFDGVPEGDVMVRAALGPSVLGDEVEVRVEGGREVSIVAVVSPKNPDEGQP